MGANLRPPEVAQGAGRVLADSGMSERATSAGGVFFRAVPAGRATMTLGSRLLVKA